MSYRDADDAREASEKGKKNEYFKELVACIQMDISDATKVGEKNSSSRFSEENIAEFGDALVDWFQNLDFEATIEDRYLRISWENRDIE